jgi:Uma2 family endonuclease
VVAAPKLRFTFREYLSVDAGSTIKHEYLDGLILGMAGGTPDHARLAMAVGTLLAQQLVGKRCAVFSEALRVRALQTGFAGYPDVTVICDALTRDPEDANTITNPSVVVEVLSPSTADYDRGDKLRHYQTIPSLRHVVLVSYETPQIDVWTRQGEGWSNVTFRSGERAELAAIGCALDVDAVFRDPLTAA